MFSHKIHLVCNIIGISRPTDLIYVLIHVKFKSIYVNVSKKECKTGKDTGIYMKFKSLYATMWMKIYKT